MSFDWEVANLGALTVNLDTRRKPVKEADRKPGPYPYYGASGIVDYVSHPGRSYGRLTMSSTSCARSWA